MLAFVLAASIFAAAADSNLELLLQPESIVNGMPQAFTFSLVNTSDHDVLVPAPSIDCEDAYDGVIWLQLEFRPSNPQAEPGPGSACASDRFGRPPILKRVREWKTLHAGQTLSWNVPRQRLNYEDKDAGIYEFWAEYDPPAIGASDRETLQRTGIDVPHGKLTSSHIAFRKEP